MVGHLKASPSPSAATQVAILPPDAGGLTHFGNMALRVMQRHMHAQSRQASGPPGDGQGGEEDAILPVLHVAITLFHHAIRLTRHNGALSSLGVLWKLYPSLMERNSEIRKLGEQALTEEAEARTGGREGRQGGREGEGSMGYFYLCQARESFVKMLARHHREQCASLTLVSGLGPGGGWTRRYGLDGGGLEEEEEGEGGEKVPPRGHPHAKTTCFEGQELLWTHVHPPLPLSLTPYQPHPPLLPPPGSGTSSPPPSLPLTHSLFLLRLPNVYVQGPDGAVHDLYRTPPPLYRTNSTSRPHARHRREESRTEPASPPPCHIYAPSAGCYLALGSQLSYPDRSLPLVGAASLLTAFSGGAFYYHWLLDSLPRLLLLRQALLEVGPEGGRGGRAKEDWERLNITLIVPPSGPKARYVDEGLRLLAQALDGRREEPGEEPGEGGAEGEREQGFDRPRTGRPLSSSTEPERIVPWPFQPLPFHYNGSGVVAVQTLYLYDWAPALPPSSPPLPPHLRLCAPPAGLRLLRSTLLPSFPPAHARRSLVWLYRDPWQPRAVGNEAALLLALQRLAETELGAIFQVLEGSKAGLSGALRVLPQARVVVGVHGANLANAVFCANGTRLVELTMQEPEFREYEYLASAIGLIYRPLEGQVPANGFEDIVWVNEEEVVAAVRAAWREGGEEGGEREEWDKEKDEL